MDPVQKPVRGTLQSSFSGMRCGQDSTAASICPDRANIQTGIVLNIAATPYMACLYDAHKQQRGMVMRSSVGQQIGCLHSVSCICARPDSATAVASSAWPPSAPQTRDRASCYTHRCTVLTRVGTYQSFARNLMWWPVGDEHSQRHRDAATLTRLPARL